MAKAKLIDPIKSLHGSIASYHRYYLRTLHGKTIIDVTDNYCEYQCRAHIFDVDSFDFGPGDAARKIYRFGIALGNPESPLYAIIYVPAGRLAKGYEPKEGDDVDMIFWMQGRIVDDPLTEDEVIAQAEEAGK